MVNDNSDIPQLPTHNSEFNNQTYPHPWTQDQALTDRLLRLVDDEDWDLFGIADVGPLNEKARPGRRPKDLWPTATKPTAAANIATIPTTKSAPLHIP